MKSEILRMWRRGPLRRFIRRSELESERPPGDWETYTSQTLDGYAGAYVCERCLEGTIGVYKVKNRWLCGTCRGGRGKCRALGPAPSVNRQNRASDDSIPAVKL